MHESTSWRLPTSSSSAFQRIKRLPTVTQFAQLFKHRLRIGLCGQVGKAFSQLCHHLLAAQAKKRIHILLHAEGGDECVVHILAAQALLTQVSGQDVNHAFVSTLSVEQEVNTFFRLGSQQVVAELRKSFPDLPEQPDTQTVFQTLRELRNSW